MKLIYVLGPYRSPTEHGVAENIRCAEALAVEVGTRAATAVAGAGLGGESQTGGC
jgi:hypothetical protein